MRSNRVVIVNSDDFGISDAVNDATVRAFETGCISSTTMMASMAGFGDAVERANTNPILKNAIGLHMNLTQGTPLTEPIKKCPTFCADGVFTYNRQKALFTLSADEKKAVHTEITAQLKRLLDNHIVPTHFDSHHHVHTEFGVINVYLQVAKEHGIKKVRLTKNIGKTSKAKQIYKQIYNTYIRSRFGMQTTDIFCSANEYASIINDPAIANKNIEIMVHAMLNDKKEVVDIDKVNLEAKMHPLLKGLDIKSYYAL